MKCCAALLLVLVSGCASSPEGRTQLTIKNSTMELLEVKVGSGVFGTTVYLAPGGGWSGFVDRRWISTSAWVEIKPAVPQPLR